MSRYSEVHAHIDPDQFDEFPNGICVQEIDLIFNDDPDRPAWKALQPAVCAIGAARARELAFELLMLAELAEHWERAR